MDLLSETVNHKSRNEGIVFMGPEPRLASAGVGFQKDSSAKSTPIKGCSDIRRAVQHRKKKVQYFPSTFLWHEIFTADPRSGESRRRRTRSLDHKIAWEAAGRGRARRSSKHYYPSQASPDCNRRADQNNCSVQVSTVWECIALSLISFLPGWTNRMGC
jgi:hypothetical protein